MVPFKRTWEVESPKMQTKTKTSTPHTARPADAMSAAFYRAAVGFFSEGGIMRRSEFRAADGRRLVVRYGTGYAPTVSEYHPDRGHTREYTVRSGLAAARRLAKDLAAE